jgi:hypothetical protein
MLKGAPFMIRPLSTQYGSTLRPFNPGAFAQSKYAHSKRVWYRISYVKVPASITITGLNRSSGGVRLPIISSKVFGSEIFPARIEMRF